MFEQLTLNQMELLRVSLDKFIVRGAKNRIDKSILLTQLDKEIENYDDANSETV